MSLWSAAWNREPSVPASAIHHWRLGEGTGTSAADSIGTATGTVNGAVWLSGTWVDGFALDGDGVDDYIDLTTLGTYGSSVANGPHAIAYTIQTADTTSKTHLGTRQVTTGADQFYRVGDPFGGAAGYHVHLQDSAGVSLQFDAADFVSGGAKHRIVCNIDPDTPAVDVYDNGSAVAGTLASAGVPTLQDFTNPLWGLALNNKGAAAGLLDGNIDDVILCNSMLSAQEIANDLNRQPWY